ncbi:MAG: hypothetical protein OXG72_14425, partial [Acidobacteria bacterium]|nr:hypothetical protein [Acidobacteriota bacterium]
AASNTASGQGFVTAAGQDFATLALSCVHGGCEPPPGKPWSPPPPHPASGLLAHDATPDTPKPTTPKVCIGYCPGANPGMSLPDSPATLPWFDSDPSPLLRSTPSFAPDESRAPWNWIPILDSGRLVDPHGALTNPGPEVEPYVVLPVPDGRRY